MDANGIKHGRNFADWLSRTADQLSVGSARTHSVATICDTAARSARADERARIRRKAAAYDRRRALPALLTLSPVTAFGIAASCENYQTRWVISMLCRRINQQIKLRCESSAFFDRRYLADLRAALGGEIARRRHEAG